MLEMDFIRQNTSAFEEAMKNRGMNSLNLQKILELDSQKRKLIAYLHSLQQEKNAIVKRISMNMKGDNTADIRQSNHLTNEISKINTELEANDLTKILTEIPNIPDEDVPIGDNELDNIEIRKYGHIRLFDFPIKSHDELGEMLGLMDFKTASQICGSRFVFLKKELALMERALASMMLTMHTQEFGYIELSMPTLVKDQAMYNVGQLPKFDTDSFKTTCGYRLIPTGEVTLTNIAAGQIFNEDVLPMRLTTVSNCFRSEAGSAGKDTKGMIRQHQFSKAELVSFTTENQSKDELERMVSIAEEILKRLEIPYRVILLCTGDMGFSSKKTYDIEVWMPHQNKYREISSCSNCGTFQAVRMNAKYKSGKKKSFVHTLNGSALAIGRTIAAIIENFQESSGDIIIPKALQPYMNGVSKITSPTH